MLKFNQFISELKNPKEIGIFRKQIEKDKVSGEDTQNSWRESLDEFFKRYEFRQSGTGQFASVYINKDYKYAVKVFKEDIAYLSYLRWVMKNQRNKYVPKIRGKVVNIVDNIMAVRIEKLNNFKLNYITEGFSLICNHPQMFLNGDLEEHYPYISVSEYVDKDIYSLAKFLAQPKNIKMLDIHQYNIMIRGGNHPVLIDPLYNGLNGNLNHSFTENSLKIIRDFL